MDNKKRNEIILKLVCDLLSQMNFGIESASVEDLKDEENDESKQVLVSIAVDNPAGLIGFRGKNLSFIQLILSLMVKNTLGEWIRVVLDINKYREEQKNRLEIMATNLADKVVTTQKQVSMMPMSSFERRICHMALANRDDVVSESEGEGDGRHLVIKLVS
jgi:spoIIIJ-associated protein